MPLHMPESTDREAHRGMLARSVPSTLSVGLPLLTPSHLSLFPSRRSFFRISQEDQRERAVSLAQSLPPSLSPSSMTANLHASACWLRPFIEVHGRRAATSEVVYGAAMRRADRQLRI
jgi:hypothetical protein